MSGALYVCVSDGTGNVTMIEWAPYAVPGTRCRHERPMPVRRARIAQERRSEWVRHSETRVLPISPTESAR